jgi:hypothetical protein
MLMMMMMMMMMMVVVMVIMKNKTFKVPPSICCWNIFSAPLGFRLSKILHQ